MKYLLALSFAFLFSQDTPSVEIYRRPIEQRVIVPNVVGLEFTRAVDTLIRLGLSVTEPIPSVSDYPVDRVIGQEPSRGSVVPVETDLLGSLEIEFIGQPTPLAGAHVDP